MVVKALVVKALVPLPDSLRLARLPAMTSKLCSPEEKAEQRNNAWHGPRKHSRVGSVPPLSCVRS